MKASDLEQTLCFQLRAEGITDFKTEFRFSDERRWRADFYIPCVVLLVDIQGGIYRQGKHSRGVSQEKDFEKQNAAILAGYRYMLFGPNQVKSGAAVDTIKRALKGES